MSLNYSCDFKVTRVVVAEKLSYALLSSCVSISSCVVEFA